MKNIFPLLFSFLFCGILHAQVKHVKVNNRKEIYYTYFQNGKTEAKEIVKIKLISKKHITKTTMYTENGNKLSKTRQKTNHKERKNIIWTFRKDGKLTLKREKNNGTRFDPY